MSRAHSARAFSGADYEPSLDRARLALQIERIRAWALARDRFTLREARVDLERLYAPALFPEASISAQLRNLKKAPYFYRPVKRRRAGVHGPGSGIWEYRLLAPELRPQLGLFIEEKRERPPAAPRADAASEPDDGTGRAQFFREARRIAGIP